MPWVSTHAVSMVFVITQLEVIVADAKLVLVEMEGRALVDFSFSRLKCAKNNETLKHANIVTFSFSIDRYRRVQYRNTQLPCRRKLL